MSISPLAPCLLTSPHFATRITPRLVRPAANTVCPSIHLHPCTMPPRRPAPASTAQSSTAGRTSQPTAGPSSQATVDPGTWLQLVTRTNGGRTELSAVRDLGSTLPWFSKSIQSSIVRPRLTEPDKHRIHGWGRAGNTLHLNLSRDHPRQPSTAGGISEWQTGPLTDATVNKASTVVLHSDRPKTMLQRPFTQQGSDYALSCGISKDTKRREETFINHRADMARKWREFVNSFASRKTQESTAQSGRSEQPVRRPVPRRRAA